MFKQSSLIVFIDHIVKLKYRLKIFNVGKILTLSIWVTENQVVKIPDMEIQEKHLMYSERQQTWNSSISILTSHNTSLRSKGYTLML